MEGVRQSQKRKPDNIEVDILTKREKEILGLIGQGFSEAKVIQKMGISKVTLRVYFHRVVKKKNFKNKTELIKFAKDQVVEG